MRHARPLKSRQRDRVGHIATILLTEISQTTGGSSLARPALGPVRLEFGGLGGIVEGLLVIGLRRVDSRAIGVEDMVA